MAEKLDWADPGYFSGNSRIGNSVRILVQLVRPPRGHRTLPTKTGILLILVTIGVGTAAFNTGQNILYLALSMLLSALLVSGLLSWLNFKGCRWRLETGRHFRVGEPSPVHLALQNTKRYLPSYSLSFLMETERGSDRHFLEMQERLDPGQETRLAWDFIPSMRGRETVRLKGLVSRYPFGFLRKSITDSCSREVTVWPARIAYQLGADQSGRRWLYGHHRRKGEGVELIQLRDYASGDALKRIHWKASARVGKLQVRETLQENHQAFAIRVNPSSSLWTGTERFERMCSFAATLAEDLYQRDQLRSAEIMGILRVSVGAIEDLYTFLDALAVVEQARPGPGTGSIRRGDSPIEFYPGPDGSVLARLEEATIGQA